MFNECYLDKFHYLKRLRAHIHQLPVTKQFELLTEVYSDSTNAVMSAITFDISMALEFLTIIENWSNPYWQMQALAHSDYENKNLLMCVANNSPELIPALLKIIDKLSPAEQFSLFSQVDRIHYNVLHLYAFARASHGSKSLINYIQRFSLEQQYNLLAQTDENGKFSAFMRMAANAPYLISEFCPLLNAFPETQRINLLSQISDRKRNVLMLLIIYSNKYRLDNIKQPFVDLLRLIIALPENVQRKIFTQTCEADEKLINSWEEPKASKMPQPKPNNDESEYSLNKVYRLRWLIYAAIGQYLRALADFLATEGLVDDYYLAKTCLALLPQAIEQSGPAKKSRWLNRLFQAPKSEPLLAQIGMALDKISQLEQLTPAMKEELGLVLLNYFNQPNKALIFLLQGTPAAHKIAFNELSKRYDDEPRELSLTDTISQPPQWYESFAELYQLWKSQNKEVSLNKTTSLPVELDSAPTSSPG